MRIKIVFCLVISLLNAARIASAQTVPKEIWGKWVVRREVSTTTISCWGEPDAHKIIGSELEYSGKIFRWSSIITNDPVAESKIIYSSAVPQREFRRQREQFSSGLSTARH